MNGESEGHIFVSLPCCKRKNAVTFHRHGWDADRQAVCGRVRCARTFHFASIPLAVSETAVPVCGIAVAMHELAVPVCETAVAARKR